MKNFKAFRENLTEAEVVQESGVALPPNILILKRQSIRHFPGQTLVALYYNDKLNQFFSIPFGGEDDNIITPTSMKEDQEQLDELHAQTLTSYIDKRGKQVRDSIDSGNGAAKFTHFKGLGKAATKLSYKAASTMKMKLANNALSEEQETLLEIDLGKGDHEVIKAFLNKKPHKGSKKLSTDGKRLDGNWLGGSGIAHHSDKGVHLNELGSKSAQQVHRAIKKHNSLDSHSDVPHHNLIHEGKGFSELRKEQEEVIEEAMDAIAHLRSVKEFHTAKALKHNDGTQTKIDPTTAHALLTVHDALHDDNKKKFADHLVKSKGHFHKMLDFAWKSVSSK